MNEDVPPLTAAWIEGRILDVSGQRVMLDVDLARVYGVTNKRLTEQVRRNASRFPPDFAWTLSAEEVRNLRPQFAAASSGWGGRRQPPWVFTEHGAVMLANVLKSPAALMASVEIVRAFVRLRTLAAEYRDLGRRIDQLEQCYDIRFKAVFDAIHRLLETPHRQRGRIGFDAGERQDSNARSPRSIPPELA